MDSCESRPKRSSLSAGDQFTAPADAPESATAHAILAEMAAHDLREPVHAIQGVVRVLMSGKTGPLNPLQHEFLALMFVSSRRLERLINDIHVMLTRDRDFSILEEEINLRDYVLSCSNELSVVFVDAGLRISVLVDTAGSNDPARWRLRADPMRIEQIILNMLENALRYADPASTIIVRLRSSQSRILCVVENHAERLAMEDVSRWLIPFNRGHDSSVQAVDGRGLGLTVVDHLVRLHGGRLFLRRRGHLVSVGFCLHRRSNQSNPTAPPLESHDLQSTQPDSPQPDPSAVLASPRSTS